MPSLDNLILDATKSESVEFEEQIQSLWSGYGAIDRYRLIDSQKQLQHVIVKHVRLPDHQHHPRGWNTNLSHQRKIRSYEVESYFYKHHAKVCPEECRVPACFATAASDNEFLMIMEDLDDIGFSRRITTVTLTQMFTCLEWLASFHANFMNQTTHGLWPNGTYWHLETRPDELRALDDKPLQKSAQKIDQILCETEFQTFVHGDAKLANFCFSNDAKAVAAVDFQYVGGGCGMKDIAYFIGSCLRDDECEAHEDTLVDHYFQSLKEALSRRQPNLDPEAVENSWRPLFDVAWTDFHRFVKGWSPGHWKIHDYSERLARQVIQRINHA